MHPLEFSIINRLSKVVLLAVPQASVKPEDKFPNLFFYIVVAIDAIVKFVVCHI
jgi:hypothetical protein